MKAVLMVAIAVLVGVGTVRAVSDTYLIATGHYPYAFSTGDTELDENNLDFTNDADSIVMRDGVDSIGLGNGDDKINFGYGNDRIYFSYDDDWFSFGPGDGWITWGDDGSSHVYASVAYTESSGNIEISAGGDVIITLGAAPQDYPMAP